MKTVTCSPWIFMKISWAPRPGCGYDGLRQKASLSLPTFFSLAVNYHPNEVAFILIDYKGGGMAKAFERLPHTVGIITNLDGAAVNRSLVSIQSELKRRQAIFQSVSKRIGVSNIDIYKYQKLFREGTVAEPFAAFIYYFRRVCRS